MAIAATSIYNTPTCNVWNITALDADATAVNVAHGMSATPKMLGLTQQFTLANVNAINWSITANSVNVVINKNNVNGSGGTTPGTTVVAQAWAMYPHSIL